MWVDFLRFVATADTERDTILSIHVHPCMYYMCSSLCFALDLLYISTTSALSNIQKTYYRRVLSPPPMSSAINEPSPTSFRVASAHAVHKLQIKDNLQHCSDYHTPDSVRTYFTFIVEKIINTIYLNGIENIVDKKII